MLFGDGTLVSGEEPATPSHSSGAGSEEATGDSVEILSTILDRQSKLDTTGFLLLLASADKSTIKKNVSITIIHHIKKSFLHNGTEGHSCLRVDLPFGVSLKYELS